MVDFKLYKSIRVMHWINLFFVWTYRYETTGIRPEYLRDAMPLRQVQRKIQDFLCNGEPMWKIRPKGGKARILVGHGLDHDLDRLQIEYPVIMMRYYLQRTFKIQKKEWRLIIELTNFKLKTCIGLYLL